MRLLSTSHYLLKEFNSSDIPKYAILSHRWEGQEVTFQELQAIDLSPGQCPRVTDKHGETVTGWSKIKGACTQARKDGHKWIWIDSCCIDKSSSAELSEAINSMFNWYKNAEICYAYLSDVQFDYNEYVLGSRDCSPDEFRQSKWFTRGWTLQELLAPRQLRFFSRRWIDLGDRGALWSVVSIATGIEGWSSYKTATIAQKMSWASRRETTRIEDRAYSLMGLFAVNMPPLYGEGENAFIRLQLEILRISDDESIFAWEDPADDNGGLLARSPDAFRKAGDVKRLDNMHYEKPPYSMTNKGLRVEFPVLSFSTIHVELLDADDTFLAFLQCRSAESYGMLAILLRRIRANLYTKVSSGGLIHTSWSDLIQEKVDNGYRMVQVKQEDDSDLSFAGLPQYRFSIPIDALEFEGFKLRGRWLSWGPTSRGRWDSTAVPGEETISIDRHIADQGITVAMEFRGSDRSENEQSALGRTEGFISESDKFIIIFNMYAGRARLALLKVYLDRSLRSILEHYVRPGDWMTAGPPLRSSERLGSGTMVTAQLARKPTDLWLRSYQANFSFDKPVEMDSIEAMPNFSPFDPRYPLVNSDINRPVELVELPNNEVESFQRQNLRNSMSGDPNENYYVRSYLECAKGEAVMLGSRSADITNTG